VSTDDDLLEALQKESNSINAPKTYREVMSKVFKEMKQLQETAASYRTRIEALSTQSSQYTKYVKAAEDNYGFLSELYKEEHKSNLDKQEEIISLQSKLNFIEVEQEAKTQKLKQEFDQFRAISMDKFKKQEEEYKTKMNRQAIGRRNIEESLYNKDQENIELKKRLEDMEVRLATLEAQKAENEKKMKEQNSQLQLLASYFQPKAAQLQQGQALRLAPQQVQIIQQQQAQRQQEMQALQQQQQHQQRPPHYQ
jgi:chromosome segregation ATPase